MNKGTESGLTTSDLVPPGVIWELAGATIPAGWLLADGSAVSRSQYPNLFKAIGIQHGAGNGITTFNLPNRSGRVGVGRDTGQAEFATIAQVGGAKDKTMQHTHSLQNHSHARTASGPSASDTGAWQSPAGWTAPSSHQGWVGETQDHAHQGTTTTLGGNFGDGFQGFAMNNQHWGFQTTDRTGQVTVGSGGPTPINNNTGYQDHTHGLENHTHALMGHTHTWAHTHADSYGTSATNTTTDSSVTAPSGNLQPYVVANFIVKY